MRLARGNPKGANCARVNVTWCSLYRARVLEPEAEIACHCAGNKKTAFRSLGRLVRALATVHVAKQLHGPPLTASCLLMAQSSRDASAATGVAVSHVRMEAVLHRKVSCREDAKADQPMTASKGFFIFLPVDLKSRDGSSLVQLYTVEPGSSQVSQESPTTSGRRHLIGISGPIHTTTRQSKA